MPRPFAKQARPWAADCRRPRRVTASRSRPGPVMIPSGYPSRRRCTPALTTTELASICLIHSLCRHSAVRCRQYLGREIRSVRPKILIPRSTATLPVPGPSPGSGRPGLRPSDRDPDPVSARSRRSQADRRAHCTWRDKWRPARHPGRLPRAMLAARWAAPPRPATARSICPGPGADRGRSGRPRGSTARPVRRRTDQGGQPGSSTGSSSSANAFDTCSTTTSVRAGTGSRACTKPLR